MVRGAAGCGVLSLRQTRLASGAAAPTRWSADAEPALELGDLAPADRQRLAAAEPDRVAVDAPFERVDVREAHEDAAVDPDELVRELVLEALQRLVDHVLAAKMAHRHVLLLRAEVPDLLDGDQPELVADSRRDMPARPGYRLPRQLVEERRADARRVRERRLEPLAADRFQQIAHGPGLECLDRVLIVRRREDHGRRDLEAAEMPRGLDAAHARHLDVEQHDLRLEPRRLLDRLGARCACARDAPALELADEPLEALARRRLVVDDQHFS